MRLANNPEFGYAEACAFLEEHLSNLLPIQSEDADALLQKRFDFDPWIFGGNFPVLTVEEESGATYRNKTDRSHLPAVIPVAIRIYDIALALARRPLPDGSLEVKRDARAQAKRRCRTLWGEFYKNLRKDPRIGNQVMMVDVVTVEAGDADALGNPRIDDTGTNVLWCLKATLEVTM